MDLYRTTVFFSGARDPLTMLLDDGDETRLRMALADQQTTFDLKRHGFINGNDTGVRVSINGRNVDYMTSEIFVPQGS